MVIDTSNFLEIFITKQLYLFIIFICLSFINILIVIYRLIKSKRPKIDKNNNKLKHNVINITYRIRFMYPFIAFAFSVFTLIYSYDGLYYSYKHRL